MEDVAPQLIEDVTAEFHKLYDSSGTIQTLLEKVRNGTATYAEAQEYSLEVSRLIGNAFEAHISSAVLPDGKMYYNIASRLIPSTMDENYVLVSDYALKVQHALNAHAGIGLNAKVAPQNQARVEGLVDMVSSAVQYDDVSGRLLSAVENYSQNIVDETIKENADFHAKAGLFPKIIRRATFGCCKWCRGLAGTYDYRNMPENYYYGDDFYHAIYRRHENCRCTVLYDPGDGRRQNVHTRKLTSAGQSDTIEARRKTGLSNLGTFRPNDQHNTVQKYVAIDRQDVVSAAKAGKRHSGVYIDAMNKTKKQLQRSIINRVAEVERHADKIRHPETYVADWATLDPRYQAGLLRKWEKDMHRNAEQAEIELSVFEERF